MSLSVVRDRLDRPDHIFPPTRLFISYTHSEVRRDPYGVVLVIAPFNYPFQARIYFY